MQLTIKPLKFDAGRPIAILNHKTADKANVHVGERIVIENDGKKILAVVDTASGLIKENQIVVSQEVVEELLLKKRDRVYIRLARKPESMMLIHKKLDCHPLNKKELRKIVDDIVKNALTETEIACFVAAVYKCGMSIQETENMIKAIVETGKTLNLKGKVADKHSIGGIAGNRTTPLVVSICASKNLLIPKNSSRAITSAAGTADVLEAITGIEFSPEEIKKIIKKTNACMVWGGALGLSPADDKLIQIERILNLDPEAQLLASVLSKKISVGSKYVILDIPYGKGAKVDKKEGMKLKKKFEFLAKRFGINLKGVLTNGEQPIGNGIGPFLEIRDLVKVLKREEDRPLDLEKKAVFLSGELLELSNEAEKGKGEEIAKQILDSGKAFEKFNQIVQAQGGRLPSPSQIEKKLGKLRKTIYSKKNLTVKEIDNKKINMMGTMAGSPMDKGAGLYLHCHVKDRLKRAQPIITIYAESKVRLDDAMNFYKRFRPIEFF